MQRCIHYNFITECPLGFDNCILTPFMKILYLSFFLFLPLIARQNDPIAKTAQLIGHGNVPELAKLFAPTVDLTIGEDVNTYSAEQATTILTKFFAQNK